MEAVIYMENYFEPIKNKDFGGCYGKNITKSK